MQERVQGLLEQVSTLEGQLEGQQAAAAQQQAASEVQAAAVYDQFSQARSQCGQLQQELAAAKEALSRWGWRLAGIDVVVRWRCSA